MDIYFGFRCLRVPVSLALLVTWIVAFAWFTPVVATEGPDGSEGSLAVVPDRLLWVGVYVASLGFLFHAILRSETVRDILIHPDRVDSYDEDFFKTGRTVMLFIGVGFVLGALAQ